MSSPFSRTASATLALASAAFLLATSLTAGVTPPGFPPIPKGELKAAALGPKEPDLEIDYPGGAAARGIVKGTAMVSILVEADGKASDYLVTNCTDPSFGKKLLEQAKIVSFQSAKFKDVAVPSRLTLGYTFNSKNAAVNPMEAARHRMEEAGGQKQAFSAVTEKEIDQQLEFVQVALPPLPPGYPAGKTPVKVFVTFYVDEEGHARIPNVESAAAPELVAGAVAAVRQWVLKPVTVKGKPALVFTGRPVRFIPPEPSAGAAK